MWRAIIGVVFALTGCAAGAGSAITSLATAGVAGTVGSATGSALLGTATGIAVSYGVYQGVKYSGRRIANNVQDAVAIAAGPLAVGEAADWTVPEKLPLTDRSGKVQVARTFGEAIPCKDVVFTVGDDPNFYTATICRNKDGEWRWAAAEPSIHRWDYLQ